MADWKRLFFQLVNLARAEKMITDEAEIIGWATHEDGQHYPIHAAEGGGGGATANKKTVGGIKFSKSTDVDAPPGLAAYTNTKSRFDKNRKILYFPKESKEAKYGKDLFKKGGYLNKSGKFGNDYTVNSKGDIVGANGSVLYHRRDGYWERAKGAK